MNCILHNFLFLYNFCTTFYNFLQLFTTFYNCTRQSRIWYLAADCPLVNTNQSRFYHTSSHYLSHKTYYYSYLVMIALGCSRNLMVYSRRFTSTKRLYIQPYHSMSDNSRFIFAIPSLHTHR